MSFPEYACLVWNPFYQCHLASMEAVERKFLIYLHFKVFGVFPLVGTHNHTGWSNTYHFCDYTFNNCAKILKLGRHNLQLIFYD
jgi:hypothetical protein